jgi:transcriptional regulator with XRE-family HTH domain
MRSVPADDLDERLSRALGLWVRELRHRRGFTQPVAAERAGISVAYLSEIETGRRNPTVAIVVRLARALEVKPSQLMARLDQVE